MTMMHDEAAAIRTYGAVALVMLFAFAYAEGSAAGMAFAVVTAAFAYLFQMMQFVHNHVVKEGEVGGAETAALVFFGCTFVSFGCSFLATLFGV